MCMQIVINDTERNVLLSQDSVNLLNTSRANKLLTTFSKTSSGKSLMDTHHLKLTDDALPHQNKLIARAIHQKILPHQISANSKSRFVLPLIVPW